MNNLNIHNWCYEVIFTWHNTRVTYLTGSETTTADKKNGNWDTSHVTHTKISYFVRHWGFREFLKLWRGDYSFPSHLTKKHSMITLISLPSFPGTRKMVKRDTKFRKNINFRVLFNIFLVNRPYFQLTKGIISLFDI